ncbi:MAG: ABC transporter permease, partial [Clostridiaceae bacterium]|nr:ABC transporter permease [Clostridiaceae bacterium]
VTMKATGFLLLFPIGGYFFLDAKEWLFAIAPGHWAAKAVQRSMMAPLINAGAATMNLGLRGYAIIGIVYNLILAYGAYRLFLKKNQL